MMLIDRLSHRTRQLKRAWRCDGLAGAARYLGRQAAHDLVGAARLGYSRLAARNGLAERRILGSRMLLRTDDPGLSRRLIVAGCREMATVHIIQEVLEAGMTVIDVGANLGYFALLEARIVGPAGKVYAIEPAPGNMAILRRNIALNALENVETFELAISDESQDLEMHLPAGSNFGWVDPVDGVICPRARNALTGGAQRDIRVPAMSLDDFIARQGVGRVDLIRMDIEGYETVVTAGLRRTLSRMAGPIRLLIEVHANLFSDPMTVVAPWLNGLFELGFRPEAMTQAGCSPNEPFCVVRGLGPDDFVEAVCTQSFPQVLLVWK